MSNEMRALIMRSTAIHEVKRLARQQGMLTLWESGVKKALRGMTSLENCCASRARTMKRKPKSWRSRRRASAALPRRGRADAGRGGDILGAVA